VFITAAIALAFVCGWLLNGYFSPDGGFGPGVRAYLFAAGAGLILYERYFLKKPRM